MLQWITKHDKNNELVLVCPNCDYWRGGYDFDNLFLPRYCEHCGERLDEFKVLNQREGRLNAYYHFTFNISCYKHFALLHYILPSG